MVEPARREIATETSSPPVSASKTDDGFTLAQSAELSVDAVLAQLVTRPEGLNASEVAVRRAQFGPNALRSHGASPWHVFASQLRNPLLILLLGAAAVSTATGDTTNAAIITVIVSLSVGLGFFNEFRSEQAVQALHDSMRRSATITREGAPITVDVVDIVPGDIVMLRMGDIVPADLRLIAVSDLECDESVLTGESIPTPKSTDAIAPGHGPQELSSCAFMGTIVQQGSGTGVAVCTGPRTAFGQIALQLGERQPQTAFQLGLASFSNLLIRVTAALTISIFVINLVLHRPLIEALLFSLAIAIGLTPQLLPAIVTISLSTGARRLAQRKVLVKRLVSIEDLGNITTLFTDKTGTLTEGHITFDHAIGADGGGGPSADRTHLLALLCNEAILDGTRAVSGNQLDVALWDNTASLAAEAIAWKREAIEPFDHNRRVASVIVTNPSGETLMITKGEPEGILTRCLELPPGTSEALDALFDQGARVIAVATKAPPANLQLTPADEHDLHFEGFLTFTDRPKADAAVSLQRLRDLGIDVKIVTGDSERVAIKVCADLGMTVTGSLTGAQVAAMTDEQLTSAIASTTVFARIGPDQKARIIRMHRAAGADVAVMGDGVNDAVALHCADVGISVDTATEVAKDAADILLLERDLGVLADGVVEGRRIFANTIKYVLMATSSNFGNMFSAAGASTFLSYLPMLPSQILLNNLIYDVSQMAIPGDNVDPEVLARPAHWDIHFIRRFMRVFGPISSLFDFATFAVLLGVLHADQREFRTGWFVESLATQSLIIFVIRTRRIPFFRSRPSKALAISAVTSAAIGALLPFSPFASMLGFTRLPASFFGVLLLLVLGTTALAETAKRWFYASAQRAEVQPVGVLPKHEHHIHRRAAGFSHNGPLQPSKSTPVESRRDS